MGQAWCKEKTSKAQDSKSPLDRVFVHCAHRIYPSLKEEGSVLGGATQRVTSSEIGYAGSPPREVLTRGRSIDSVDRPFHPSDWVDVNLEVPSTPRASSVLTNLTVDTSLYPATTPTSSCSNLKDVTPVPPPRRRKRNKGRPLPPKPDEIPENSTSNLRHTDASEEPLYSSVKLPKTNEDEEDTVDEHRTDKSPCYHEDAKHEGKRTKEIYQHKVNGTGRIISSDVVSGKRTASIEERKTCRTSETSQYHRRIHENEEYERFAKNQSVKDSSTPNRQDGRKSKEAEKRIKNFSDDIEKVEEGRNNARTKNYSTVSLPNYDELDVARHLSKRTKDDGGDGERTKSRRPVRSSTGSLPAESFLSPFSEKTCVRLEDYIPRRGSNENLSPYHVLEKLNTNENGVVAGGFVKYDPNKLEDWDLNDISNCELNHNHLPFAESTPAPKITDEEHPCKSEDVVDFSLNEEIDDRERIPADREIFDTNATDSRVSLEKPEGFGKTASPIPSEQENSRARSHLKYFDPPTLAGTCKDSAACDSTTQVSREPFFLDETKHRSVLDTIGGSCRNDAITVEADRSEQSRMIFGRSLSNESEPYDDAYEAKELRGHHGVTSNLIRTISEESLPREMLDDQDEFDDFFDEKLAKEVHNKMKKDRVDLKAKTPPPSPEPRIKAEILDNDHSTLLKVLKEDAAEESNLSSMTPSLTELEAALSDMLEKEEPQEETTKCADKTETSKSFSRCTENLIEPEIVPVEKNLCSFNEGNVTEGKSTIEIRERTGDKTLVDEDFEARLEKMPVSQVLEERKPPKGRKVSFCAWEESTMAEIDLSNDREFIDRSIDLEQTIAFNPHENRAQRKLEEIERYSLSPNDSRDESRKVVLLADVPPEKPSRLHRSPDDLDECIENIPTPPRRKNKGSFGSSRKEIESAQNGSAIADPYPNDRLI